MDQKIGEASNIHRNVTKGTPIFCTDGLVGEVHDVLIDPETGKPTHIILREGILVIKEVNILRDLITLAAIVKNVVSPLRAGRQMLVCVRVACACESERRPWLASISKTDAGPVPLRSLANGR
jgi:hypothetical protein